MVVQVGDTLPNVKLSYVPYDPSLESSKACGIPQPLKLREFLKGKRAVILGVPGAFTPACTQTHLPSFVENHAQLRRKGIDVVICVSTTDAFVMSAFGRWAGVGDKVIMAGDGNGELVSALGLDQDLTKMGLGKMRSKRFALVADDLKVTYVGVEQKPGVTVSGAPAVLAKL